MSIRFICGCGKHLKARDEMASRRSACPRCGAPVGIPPRAPALPGAQGPMTPQERLRRARERPPAADAPAAPPQEATTPAVAQQAGSLTVPLLAARKVRLDLPNRGLAVAWAECLLHPFRAMRPLLVLSFLLAGCTGVAALFPLEIDNSPDNKELWNAMLTGGAACLLVLSVLGSFLASVLDAALRGEVVYVSRLDRHVVAVLPAGGRWLVCFLAGPVVFAAAAWLYWRGCGDPTWVDWLILTELGAVGAATMVLALLSVAARGKLRDVQPLAVIDLAHQLGGRVLAFVLAGGVLFALHGLALAAGVVAVQDGETAGWPVLAGVWVSGVFGATVFFRVLGVWLYRRRRPARAFPATSQKRAGLTPRAWWWATRRS